MAVFTPVSMDEARRFASEYGLRDVTALTPITHGVENTNYRLEADGRAFALTLFERRVRAEDLPFILGLTSHLADRGYPAPRPEARPEGGFVGALNGRPAALIEWLPGDWARAPRPAERAAAGDSLAHMHAASDDYAARLPNRFGPEAWRTLADACVAASRAPYEALTEDLARAVEALSSAWPEGLPAGPIHGDFFPDNVLMTDGVITGVIDYYFGCTDARAYDLAIAINAWGFDIEGRFMPDATAEFCRGYAARRPLTPAERETLPVLCAGAAARFTLSRLYDILYAIEDAVVVLKDPEQFARRLRFHRDVADASTYGV